MKTRYRLTCRGSRGGKFYCVDTLTGKRASLQTGSEEEARQLVEAKNQAQRQPVLNSASACCGFPRTMHVALQPIIFLLPMVFSRQLSGKIYTPEQIFNFVWNALGEDETYRQMRSKRNRCIRLEYADGRKFYLDVTPAVPDWAREKFLYVPDRERQNWCSSHPIGFCDDWFKKIAEVMPTIRRPLFLNGSM
jgi:hypothetical protein